ncbi:MAG: hypothetical protein PVI56_06155, partial [Gammaproteobacteria bacterium]
MASIPLAGRAGSTRFFGCPSSAERDYASQRPDGKTGGCTGQQTQSDPQVGASLLPEVIHDFLLFSVDGVSA